MAKVDIARLKVGVDIDVNKVSINELKKSLQDVVIAAEKAKFQGNLSKELDDAAKSAQQLSTILTQSWNSKLNKLDLSKFQKSVVDSYKSVSNLKAALEKGGVAGATAYNKIAQAALTTNVQIQKSNQLLDKMAVTMGNTIRFGISSAVFNKMTSSISEAYNYAKRLDKSLNDIRIVSGASADEMARFAKQANKAAKDFSSSTLDYTNAALIYYQQGLPEDQIKERTDITIKMANTLGSSAEEVSDYMTAIWNNFAKGGENLERFADVITALGAKTASSAEEISEGLEKFAAVGDTVGLSYDYAAAALTTVTDRTRQSADVVGNAFKTLFSRIQDLKLGETLDDGTTLGKYSEALEKVGISIKDQNGELKDMDVILNEMGAKWQTLSQDQQVALAEAVGGVRQYTQLIALMDNWDFMQENLETAVNATGELNKQQEIYADSVEAHLNKLKTEAEKTYATLFDTDAIKSFADVATKALSILNSYLTGLGGGLNSLTTLAANATGIFSNQIGGFFQEQAENRRSRKENLDDQKIKDQFAESMAASSSEAVVNQEALNTQIQYYNQIKEIRGQINEEEAQELNSSLVKIGQLKEQIKFAQDYKTIAESAGAKDTSKEGIKLAVQSQQKDVNDLILKINEAKEAFADYNKLMQEEGNMWPSDEYRQTVEDFFKEYASYQKDGSIAAEEAQAVMEKISKGETLGQKELNILLKGHNQELQESQDKLYKLKGAYQGCLDIESQTTLEKETQLAQEEAILQKKIQQKKEQEEYAQLVRGVSTLISTISSISGIASTIKDEDLSSWDKFKSVVSVVTIQGLTLAKNWKSVTAIFSKVATGFKGLAAAAEMSVAALGAVVAVIAAVVAGLVALGYAAYLQATKLERENENLKKSVEGLKEEVDELGGKVKDLKTKFDELKSAEEVLDNCARTSKEWSENLDKVNQKVDEILKEYPDLLKVEGIVERDEKTGKKTLNKELFEEKYLEQQERELRIKTGAYYINQGRLAKNETQIAYKKAGTATISGKTEDTSDITRTRTKSALYTISLSNEDIDKIRNTKDNNELSSELTKMADRYYKSDYGISKNQFTDEFVKSFSNNRQSLDDLNTTIQNTNSTLQNVEEYLIPDDVVQEGAYTEQKYKEEVDSTTLTDTIRQKEKDSVAQIHTDKNKDAIVFMRNYIEALGEEFDASKFTGVEGNDENREYVYNGEHLNADTMAAAIATAIQTEGYSFNTFSNEGWEGVKTSTEENKVNTEDVIKTSQEDIDKAVSELNISGELAQKLLSKSLESLTTNDIELLRNLDPEKIKSIFEELGIEGAEGFIEGFNDKKIDEQAAKNLITENKQADERGEKEAEAVGLDVEEFKIYRDLLAQTNEELRDNRKALNEVSVANKRMEKGVRSLCTDWDDYNDVMKDSKAKLEDVSRVMPGINKALKDILNLSDKEFELLPPDFAKKNWKLITDVTNGVEGAVDRLRNVAGEEILLNLGVDVDVDKDGKLDEAFLNLHNKIAQYDQEKFDVGVAIDPAQEAEFYAACNEIINAAGMTASQAQAYFKSMGYDAEIEEIEAPPKETPWHIDNPRLNEAKTKEAGVPIFDGKETLTGTNTSGGGKALAVKVITPNGTYGGGVGVKTTAPKSATSAKKPKSSGGGGSSKKEKNKSDEKSDRYQEVNTQLAKTSSLLQKIQAQTDKMYGVDLVENLNAQIVLLNKNIDLTKKKLQIAQGELAETSNALKQYGIQFNADGSINQSSYVSAFNREQSRYTNAYTDDEAAKERWEKFKEQVEKYNELFGSTIPGLEQDMLDDLNTIIDNQIQAFNVKFEIALDLTEARKEWLEFKKNVLEEVSDENILGTLKNYGEQLNTFFREDKSGAVQTDLEKLKRLNEFFEKVQKGDKSTPYGDNMSKLIEDLTEAQNQLQDDMTEYEELIDNIQQLYLEGLEKTADAFDEYMDDLEAITNTIDHEIKLLAYAQGDKAYKEQVKLYTTKIASIQSQIAFQNKEVEFWKNQLAITTQHLQNAEAMYGKDSEEYYTALEEVNATKEELKNATDDLLSSYEDKMDALTERYTANIEDIFASFNKGLMGMGLEDAESQWALLNKSSENYLDTINGIYGIQVLTNKYTESINDATVSAQNKLSKIRDEELKYLREKEKLSQYDLDRADLKYQIALKQIALEEAQQNKTTLRLRRDSQGNYSYQYTQDEDEITKLQNELSDLYNQLYNLDTGKYSENLEQIYSIMAEYQDKYKELLQDATLSDEEREAKLLEITTTYGDLMNDLTAQNEDIKMNLRESSLSEVFDLYNRDTENFAAATEQQQEILNKYLSEEIDLTNSAYNNIFGIYDDAVERFDEIGQDQIDTLISSVVPGWISAYQDIVDNLTGGGGFVESMESIQEQLIQLAQDYFGEIRDDVTQSDEVAEDYKETLQGIATEHAKIVEEYDTLLSTIAKNQKVIENFVNAWDKVAADAKSTLTDINASVEAYKKLQMEKAAEAEAKKSTGNNNTGSTGNTSGGSGSGSGSSSGGTTNNADKVEGVAAAIWMAGSDVSGWGTGSTRSARLSAKGVSGAQAYLNAHGDNGDIYRSWSNRRKELPKYYYGAFRTGGYTGDWNGDEGRVALLHKKELVLNAEDTKNLLTAIETLRYMTTSALNGYNASSLGISGNGLEQNVHIDASFPNVTNHNEIEEAINNLVNVASQRINR